MSAINSTFPLRRSEAIRRCTRRQWREEESSRWRRKWQSEEKTGAEKRAEERSSERRKWSREEKTGSEQRTGEGEDPQGNPSLCISSVLCFYLPFQILVV
ncbi:unnamed protein product [Microthlaspi erraticum]|uniref:Uncharacterized protein n=1 Tax=Microthlaspi erraticum TaxID=1685480 RepID=A0A6D2I4A7_9BRAS|nr:unnamed protein product [Microthlaspi erraticum]